MQGPEGYRQNPKPKSSTTILARLMYVPVRYLLPPTTRIKKTLRLYPLSLFSQEQPLFLEVPTLNGREGTHRNSAQMHTRISGDYPTTA